MGIVKYVVFQVMIKLSEITKGVNINGKDPLLRFGILKQKHREETEKEHQQDWRKSKSTDVLKAK